MMPNDDVKDLLASSSLAFSGSVTDVGVTSVPGIPVDDRTVIVRVDEMLAGPVDLQIPAGSQVTVQLAPELPPFDEADVARFAAGRRAGPPPIETGITLIRDGR